MCEPATLAIAATAATVIGTGVSIYGSIQQGNAQKAAADYQAQVARNNQLVSDQNAATVREQASAKQQAAFRAGEQRLGAQRAALAASGVNLDSASALDVTDATVRNTALDVENAGYAGELAAYGYRTQGVNYGAQAEMSELSGANAQSASYLSAASSFLGGASQVGSKWDAYRRTTQGGGSGLGSGVGQG